MNHQTSRHDLRRIAHDAMLQHGLQPDFSDAWSLLEALWGKLSLALGPNESIGKFAPSAFMLTLLPPRHSQRGLPLAYSDLVTLSQSGESRSDGDLEALARVLSVLAAAIARDLGLEQAFALGFGDAVAYVRPHDLEISDTPLEGAAEAHVERIVHLGFEVRVEIVRADGWKLWAQLTRDEVEHLGLCTGQLVWVQSRRARQFAES